MEIAFIVIWGLVTLIVALLFVGAIILGFIKELDSGDDDK